MKKYGFHLVKRILSLILTLVVFSFLFSYSTSAAPLPASNVNSNKINPYVFLAGETAASIAVGSYHTCVLTSVGSVKCWGRNDFGQLGDGTTINRHAPGLVKGLSSGVVAISSSGWHTCALTSSGGVKCWGYNSSGQLGNGTTNTSLTPVAVSGLPSGVISIATGYGHTCAVINGGAVKCWGVNNSGQLGDNTTTNRLTPVDVNGLSSGVTSISAWHHTCALLSGGAVRCWGKNDFGAVGDGTTIHRLIPVNVSGLTSGVIAISAGGAAGHSCALLSGGALKCWGANGTGEVGDGTTTQRLTPVNVSGLSIGVTNIATSFYHTCAIVNGAAKCWGANSWGQLGDGTTTQRLTPTDVSGLSSGVAEIDAGWSTCAMINGGTIKCWGTNDYGHLGDGTTTQRLTPVDVIGFGGVLSPFLDLPLDYSDSTFEVEAKGSNGGVGPGYVNSWFDHQSPFSTDGYLWPWDSIVHKEDPAEVRCTYGDNCYDGHEGIDFRRAKDNVLAAATGIPFGLVGNCVVGDKECGNYYGNQVWINHQNCYATLYGHLKELLITSNETQVASGQLIGIMGKTGHVEGTDGTHLHFGLYYDPNCDGDWSDKVVVDPYGWSGLGLDPYTDAKNLYLWKHPLTAKESLTTSGANIASPGGTFKMMAPPGVVVDPVTVEIIPVSSIKAALEQLRSTGYSFWLRVIEWITGGSSQLSALSTSTFNTPVMIVVKFDPSTMPHININQLVIQQFDETAQVWTPLSTTIDTINNQTSAQTIRPGYFDLQGPLVCPADTVEPNDNYNSSNSLQTSGTPVYNLFDIAQDEDWFHFYAYSGTTYILKTMNLSSGVDTVLDIYDSDGITLVVSDDNSGGGQSSLLVWQAPTNDTYFVRVRKAPGSAYGCNSSYTVSISTKVLTPTFSDVPMNFWSWDYIERLYSAGITGGCSTSPLSYCPDTSVTRAQMAVFLEKGVHHPSAYAAPNVSPTFTDTVGHWAEDWIEALRSDGITGGCGPNLYCPENPVTRAQMAVFLLKSKYGSSYNPPAVGASTGFTDVPTNHWAAPWIKQLATEGITGGCGAGIYCPESPVTRAQMAVFLVKTFNLP